MSPRLLLATAFSLAALFAVGCGGSSDDPAATEEETAEWSYEGSSGPEQWSDLDEDYELCEEGKRQSPINLTDAERTAFPRITTDYVPERVEVEDNGHAVEVFVEDPKSSITIEGTKYMLDRFHVHIPSEEAINGQYFPASIHMVHTADDGQTAVIGVFARTGKANPAFDFDVPDEVGERSDLANLVDPDALLPASDLAYRFEGSLTTPPCTEGLLWTVFQQPITLSPAQMEEISEVHDGNNRPIQPRNQRKIEFGPALSN